MSSHYLKFYFAICCLSVSLLAGCSSSSNNPEGSSDNQSPVALESTPASNLAAGSTTVTVSLETNEAATCKFSTTPDNDFASMGAVFSTTGNMNHSVEVSGLSDGNRYNYYVRCRDRAGNINDSDYLISFEVLSGMDVTPPVVSNGLPNQPLAMGTTTTTLTVQTDESAVCKYDMNAGTAYSAMVSSFDSSGSTSHSMNITSLVDGSSYVYYIRCEDVNGNASNSDYTVNFSVLSAVAAGTPWSYVGIPYTDWAYNPFTIQPSVPTEWPASPAQDYYYVEPDHPQASDSIVGGELTGTFGRFGYPDRPRVSIPRNTWIGDEYSAGTVIWLKGGTYNGNSALGAINFYHTWRPQFRGSPSQPVWIYGDPDDKPTFTGVQVQMYNSSHTILDNLQWIGGNTSNGAISLTVSDRAGPTHHITLRNLRFENMNWWGRGGAIIGMNATTQAGGVLHDVVAYNNIFKNNGGGYDWTTVDRDHHGYKINGRVDGNAAYRIWVIDNQAIRGDFPDPADGVYKSLSGNLVQVGDQVASSGNNHHVYVAGNYQEDARQALGWTKKSFDVIFSSNECVNTFHGAGGNGQCYGHQYVADHNWWINNIGRNSTSGWMHTGGDVMTGKLFVIGNLFYNNTRAAANDNWRLCSGATLFTGYGEHYFVNNVFDSACHGIWTNNSFNASSKVHIYNNIFSNISSGVDASSRAITVGVNGGSEVFIENNLFDNFSSGVRVGTTITSLNDLNAQLWASGNIVGDPLYVDQANSNYSLLVGSPVVNSGTQVYGSGDVDVYQQFINRYSGDINYPGDPADYWPKDYLKQNRVVDGLIDIGPYERQ